MGSLKIATSMLLLLAGIAQSANDKVRIDLLYESLCGNCVDDYRDQLYPVVQELSDYIDLYTYPYGKAHTTGSGDDAHVECQHGSMECFGNIIHACIMDQLPAFTKYVPVVECLFEEGSDEPGTKKCAEKFKMDAATILDCAKGMKGQRLLVHYGELTAKLWRREEDFRSVPYYLFNNKESDNYLPLKAKVCKLLNNKPEACKKFK